MLIFFIIVLFLICIYALHKKKNSEHEVAASILFGISLGFIGVLLMLTISLYSISSGIDNKRQEIALLQEENAQIEEEMLIVLKQHLNQHNIEYEELTMLMVPSYGDLININSKTISSRLHTYYQNLDTIVKLEKELIRQKNYKSWIVLKNDNT